MRLMLTLCLLILGLTLHGCRSEPVRYHTLTPLLLAPPASGYAGSTVQVDRVTVPPQVDRSQLVLRQGEHGLLILETDWWGASLADELQSALINQLNGLASGRDKTSLRVEVQRFDLVPGHYALLEAHWRLVRGQWGSDGASALHCQTLLQAHAGPSVDDLVRAQQGNLQRLASDIGRASLTGAQRCP